MFHRVNKLFVRANFSNTIIRQAKSSSILSTTALSTSLLLQQLRKPQKLHGRSFSSEATSSPTWEPKKPMTDLEQVGGNTEIISSLSDIVNYLQDPQKFIDAEISPPRGVILSGPPGVGKTMMAEAIAGQAGVPIFVVSAPEVMSIWVGGTEANLRKLFETVNNCKPCVLCIDEIDAIAAKRFSSIEESNKHHINSQVDQFLSLLSQNHPGLVIIGTTNNYKILDPAVVRPGRFDRHIYIPLPDAEARVKILEMHLKNRKLAPNVSIKDLADLSTGFSGAKLAEWCTQSARCALRENTKVLDRSHFDEARSIIEHGASPEIQKDQKQKIKTAIHEAGHALVGYYLGLKLYKVSIRKSGQGFGFNEHIVDGDDVRSLTKNEALNHICMSLAGRAAEESYGEPQFGCSDDIEKARAIAHNMVQNEGMGSSISGHALDIDIILNEQYKRAKEILVSHKNKFDNVTKELLQQNELYNDDFLKALTGQEIKKTSTFIEKPKRFLPPKKEYRGPSKLIGSPEDSVIKKELPFSLLEVAKALEVDPTKIREIKADLSGAGVEIKFKPSFNQHSHMENMSRELKKNDVENIYMDGSCFGDPYLHIYSRGISDFVEYIKKRNQLAIDTENRDDQRGFRP